TPTRSARSWPPSLGRESWRAPSATDAEACSLASWTGPLRSLVRPKSVDRPLSALYPGGGAIRRPVPGGLEGQERPRRGVLCLLRSTLLQRLLPAVQVA